MKRGWRHKYQIQLKGQRELGGGEAEAAWDGARVESMFSPQAERRMLLIERKKLKMQQRLEGKELGESIGDSPRRGEGKLTPEPT